MTALEVQGPGRGVRHQQGRLLGQVEGLGFKLKQEAVLKSLTDEILKRSEIEGERLDTEQVRSSIARRLGIDIGGLTPVDRKCGRHSELCQASHRGKAVRPARFLVSVGVSVEAERHGQDPRGGVEEPS